MKLQKDLREFIELLNSQNDDYVVVGGHAVAFHGYVRYTGDVDFLVRPTTENAARIVAVLKVFGFPDADQLKVALTEREKIVQLGRPPNRIDLLTSASGVLLANKRASGRTKDLADVEELAKVSKPR